MLAVLAIVLMAGQRQTRTTRVPSTQTQSTTERDPGSRVDIDVNLPDSVVIKP